MMARAIKKIEMQRTNEQPGHLWTATQARSNPCRVVAAVLLEGHSREGEASLTPPA